MTPKNPNLSGGHSLVAGRACAVPLYPILIAGLWGKVTPKTDARAQKWLRPLPREPPQSSRAGGIKSTSKFPRVSPSQLTHTPGRRLARSKVHWWLYPETWQGKKSSAVSISAGGSPRERRKKERKEPFCLTFPVAAPPGAHPGRPAACGELGPRGWAMRPLLPPSVAGARRVPRPPSSARPFPVPATAALAALPPLLPPPQRSPWERSTPRGASLPGAGCHQPAMGWERTPRRRPQPLGARSGLAAGFCRSVPRQARPTHPLPRRSYLIRGRAGRAPLCRVWVSCTSQRASTAQGTLPRRPFPGRR